MNPVPHLSTGPAALINRRPEKGFPEHGQKKIVYFWTEKSS